MITRRTTTLALSIAVLGSLFAFPTAASALSENPPTLTPSLNEKQPLRHKLTTVGTGNATVARGAASISITKAFATFRAPKAGVTWRARVVASYNCATNVEPANGETIQVTHFTESTPWTATKLTGTSGTLKSQGFKHQCAEDTALYGYLLVRLQVAPVGGGVYAASTLDYNYG
ncbi:MAG: hypothetical protein JWN72_1238 [Thermoleophilia bacterium]|nr:hypothetical protein [Thermoleophilia bacterium]